MSERKTTRRWEPADTGIQDAIFSVRTDVGLAADALEDAESCKTDGDLFASLDEAEVKLRAALATTKKLSNRALKIVTCRPARKRGKS